MAHACAFGYVFPMSYLWLIFAGWLICVGVIAYMVATAPEGYEDERAGFITGRKPAKGPSPTEVNLGTPDESLAPTEWHGQTPVSQSPRSPAER